MQAALNLLLSRLHKGQTISHPRHTERPLCTNVANCACPIGQPINYYFF